MMMRPEAVDHNGWVSRRKPERLGRMRPEADDRMVVDHIGWSSRRMPERLMMMRPQADDRMVGVGIGIAEECQNG